MTSSPKNSLSFSSHLGYIAQQLTGLVAGQLLEGIDVLDARRLVFLWKEQVLLIELHPDLATCLLIKRPIQLGRCKRSFELESSTTTLPVRQWLAPALTSRFLRAFASSGSLHLILELPQHKNQMQPSTIQLAIRLQARSPNLYWLYKPDVTTSSSHLQGPLWPSTWTYTQPIQEVVPCADFTETDSLNAFLQRERELVYHREQQAIHQHYKILLQNSKKRIERLQEKLLHIQSSEQLIHEGQLLQANRHNYQKGLSQLQVWDWETEANREIPLKEMPLQKQIEHCFHRAKGLQAHQKQMKEQILALQALIERDKELYRSHLEQNIAPPVKAKSSSKSSIDKAKPYRAILYQGAKIYIGKNSQDNLLVTFKIAHGNDLWLHVADYPGSHIVVKSDEITPQLLKATALLAHHYSAARKRVSVDITYTQAKWIKPLPGSKTGTVGVMQSKSYLSSYDHALIKELLAQQDSTL